MLLAGGAEMCDRPVAVSEEMKREGLQTLMESAFMDAPSTWDDLVVEIYLSMERARLPTSRQAKAHTTLES